MPAYPAARETQLQIGHKLPERSPLRRSPGICRASPAVQTTFIADTYRMGIEAFCVRPDTFERAGEVLRSVLADVVVVACSVESATPVHHVQSFRGECTILPRGAAMHHEQIDSSHNQ